MISHTANADFPKFILTGEESKENLIFHFTVISISASYCSLRSQQHASRCTQNVHSAHFGAVIPRVLRAKGAKTPRVYIASGQ